MASVSVLFDCWNSFGVQLEFSNRISRFEFGHSQNTSDWIIKNYVHFISVV